MCNIKPASASKDETGGNTTSHNTRPTEMKLAPGIYFTPSPSSNSNRVSGGSGGTIPPPPNVDDMTREELEFEYRSISKTVEKLGESNELMKKFDPKGEDGELIEAIRENTDIIIRSRLRLIAVKSRLDHLIRTQPHIKPSRPNALAERIAAATNPTPQSNDDTDPTTANTESTNVIQTDDAMNGMDL